jgi:hypothetical protein
VAKIPKNQYYPGFPNEVDPSLRRSIEHLYDRVNYLLEENSRLRDRAIDGDPQARLRLGKLEAALQAVSDPQTVGSTLINAEGLPLTPQVLNNINSNRLVGRFAAGFGPLQEVQIGTNLTLTAGGVLNATAGGSDLTPPPVTSTFTWRNQGTATVTDSSSIFVGAKKVTGWYMTVPTVAGDNLRIQEITAPATPYTFEIGIIPSFLDQTNYGAGFCWVSAGGAVATGGYNRGGAGHSLSSSKWDSPTVFNAHYKVIPYQNDGPLLFLKMQDDGTDRIISYSTTGVSYNLFHTIGRTDFLTPATVGIFSYINNSNDPMNLSLVHWIQS